MSRCDRLNVYDGVWLDGSWRDDIGVSVLGGGGDGYGKSHAIGDVLDLYCPFTDPAPAVV